MASCGDATEGHAATSASAETTRTSGPTANSTNRRLRRLRALRHPRRTLRRHVVAAGRSVAIPITSNSNEATLAAAGSIASTGRRYSSCRQRFRGGDEVSSTSAGAGFLIEVPCDFAQCAKQPACLGLNTERPAHRTGPALFMPWSDAPGLSAHTLVVRTVGQEDGSPQWGVVHEHTRRPTPVFMNTKNQFGFSPTDLGM